MRKEDNIDFDNICPSLSQNDILFVVTPSNNVRNGMPMIRSKMVIIDSAYGINLPLTRVLLDNMNINKLFIHSINLSNDITHEEFIIKSDNSFIIYSEIGINHFIHTLSQPNSDFLKWNKYSLYILRDGSYSDVKYIFSLIGESGVFLSIKSDQKSHVLNNLELRLSCYLLAMNNLDYEFVSSKNVINYLAKYKYLPSGNK